MVAKVVLTKEQFEEKHPNYGIWDPVTFEKRDAIPDGYVIINQKNDRQFLEIDPDHLKWLQDHLRGKVWYIFAIPFDGVTIEEYPDEWWAFETESDLMIWLLKWT